MAKATKKEMQVQARKAGQEIGRILRSFSPTVAAGGYVKVYSRALKNGRRRVKLYGAMSGRPDLSANRHLQVKRYLPMVRKLAKAGFVVHDAYTTSSGASYTVVVDDYIPAPVAKELRAKARERMEARAAYYFSIG